MMITIKKNKKNAEMVDLFELDGEVYRIPKNPPANIVLKYMRQVREGSEEAASAELLAGLLGEKNYAALEECDDLTMEDFQAIMLEAQKVIMGSVEEAPLPENAERG